MEKVIAIFDIGKTNKKLILFDQSYQVVFESEEKFAQTSDDDGNPCEDVKRLTEWMKSSLRDVQESNQWDISALNCTAYGASFVHLDELGKPTGPLYNYLKPYPLRVLEDFHQEHGSKLKLSVATASPSLGMLNSGLQLYLIKQSKPNLFSTIKYSLHLPQYCSYIFSNQAQSEITSIGCHTYLWDFTNATYHSWVEQEGLVRLFPPLVKTDKTFAVDLGGHGQQVGIGIHDSSAALVPYLMNGGDAFALISTGTWSIALNPFDNSPINQADLELDCLNYLTYQGNRVKASRLFLGNEYDYQQQRLMDHFNKGPDYHRKVKFDMPLAQKAATPDPSQRQFLPITMKGTGPVPDAFERSADLNLFENYEEAYHQLMLDLVSLQTMSLELITKESTVGKVFVAGGFTRNEVFMKLLATAISDKVLMTSTVTRAAALGAAMVIHRAWNPHPIDGNFLGEHVHQPVKDLDLSGYRFG